MVLCLYLFGGAMGRRAMGVRVGVVGVGAMGGPIAVRLVRAGHDVLAADLSAERLEVVARAGGRAVGGLPDLAPCQAVLLFVPSDEDVTGVAGTLAEHLAPGSALVICSSVRPE